VAGRRRPARPALPTSPRRQRRPALTARILRVANSAYYGLSGRIGTPAFAVTVVGFAHRALAGRHVASGADRAEATTPEFWTRAAAVASGASLLARRVGADARRRSAPGCCTTWAPPCCGSSAPEQHEELLARARAARTCSSSSAGVRRHARLPVRRRAGRVALPDGAVRRDRQAPRAAAAQRSAGARALQGALALVPEGSSAPTSRPPVGRARRDRGGRGPHRQIVDAAEQLAVAFNA
jgi:hypothetical protein